MNDWKDWAIIVLTCALLLTGSFWFLRERHVHNPGSKYDGYTSDQLSWVIEGRMEQLYEDFEDLIQAITRQKQLLSE